jgi:hypothetical protein
MNNLSTTDVQGIVDTAIGDLNDLSTTDVDKIVSDALGSPATEDEDGNPVDATGVYATIADLNNLSSDDVDKLITTAIEALPEGLSSDDVSTAINTALEGLENLSSTDVDTAITDALADMNNLSTTDVQGIVDTAIGDLNDLSTTDVDKIVSDALGSPATEDEPATGVYATIADLNNLSSDEVGTLIDTAIDALPEGLSAGDVSTAINTALEGLENLSSTDVDTAITDALADMNNLSSEDVDGIVDSAVKTITEDVSGLETQIGDLETQIGDVETNLEDQLDALGLSTAEQLTTIADLIGKPERAVTQEDVDFVVDLTAQENVSQELITQYDVTGDGILDINDQDLLNLVLQGSDATLADSSIFTPATGLYAQQQQAQQQQQEFQQQQAQQQQQDTDSVSELINNLNTQINAQLDTNAQQQAARDFLELEQLGAFQGARTTVTTPDPLNLDYLYDFESIFANPTQEGKFLSPYSTTTRNKPANQPTGPMPMASGFAEGGQVEDENDMLLRLLGEA